MFQEVEERVSWRDRWIGMAEHVATWSKDPSTKVGAVIVDDHQRLLSIGWNGFPRGVADDGRLHDRPVKYSLTVHAEMNAIYNAGLNGVPLFGSTLYVYGLPVCSDCAKGVIQSGVRYVFMRADLTAGKWAKSFELTSEMFREAGVTYDFV